MQQTHSTKSDAGDWWAGGCWHIGQWNPAGTRFVIVHKHCFKSESTAKTTMNKPQGLIGDRSWYGAHLEPNTVRKSDLGKGQNAGMYKAVKCLPAYCDCHRWATGHLWTPDNPKPDPEARPHYRCGDWGLHQEPDREACGQGRRQVRVVENIDTEEIGIYCEQCCTESRMRLWDDHEQRTKRHPPLYKPFTKQEEENGSRQMKALAVFNIFPVMMTLPNKPPAHAEPLIP